ncbi:MAG: ABC transporter substrate-binding protein [Methanothrix sp.]
MRILRYMLVLLIVGVVVVASLGCITKTPSENITLRIGYQPSTHQIAEMVAMEKGWWLEDLRPFGVTAVEEYEFPSGPPEMQAMLAGSLDVAYVGTAPPISAIAGGLDAKIVAGVNTNGSALALAPDKEYRGPQSLKGMSIATFPPGSIQDTVLKKWLKENGVDPSEVKVLPMGPGDAVTAIFAGQVDGTFLPEPSPSVIEMANKGKVVVYSGEMWPNHACCSLVVSGKLIREHPELVEQIVKTHIKATEYVYEHPEEAARIYANRTKQDLSVVEYSMRHWDGTWISDPHVQIPSTMEYARVNYELKYISRMPSEDELFDVSFYEKARGE